MNKQSVTASLTCQKLNVMPPQIYHTQLIYIIYWKILLDVNAIFGCCFCCCSWTRSVNIYKFMCVPSISHFFKVKYWNEEEFKQRISNENGATAAAKMAKIVVCQMKPKNTHTHTLISIYGNLLFIRLICKRPRSNCHQTRCVLNDCICTWFQWSLSPSMVTSLLTIHTHLISTRLFFKIKRQKRCY